MTRKPTYEELKKEVNALKIEIVEWEKKNESLREAYDEFKQKMESSTSELIEANKELKQKIEEVGDINQGLKDSQHFLQTLIDTVEGEMFVKDANGTYLFVNKAFGKDFGVDPNDVIGKDDFFVFSSEIAAKLQENDKRIMIAKKNGKY
jgi:PAS domain-containing protein